MNILILSEELRAYNVISVFSGAMGLDIGVEQTSRFRIAACVEKEAAFCDTIRANRAAGRLDPNLKVFEGDIQGIDPFDVLKATGLEPGQVDLLVGGPPCQSFSTAGRRRTTQDPRGTLLWQFLRYVEACAHGFSLWRTSGASCRLHYVTAQLRNVPKRVDHPSTETRCRDRWSDCSPQILEEWRPLPIT